MHRKHFTMNSKIFFSKFEWDWSFWRNFIKNQCPYNAIVWVQMDLCPPRKDGRSLKS